MSNLTNNTAELRDILAAVNALPEAGSGVITPEGTIEITENGTHDVTNYATAEVNVPSKEPVLQEGSAVPTKSQQTVKPPSGVDGFSKFVVEKIPDQYVVPEGTVEIIENGEHDVSGYASVDVNVQPKTEELTITQNGEYTPGAGVDGFSKVIVDVPTNSGGDGNNVIDGLLTRSGLTELINDRITSVGLNALNGCDTLMYVRFPNVTSCDTSAFQNCSALEQVDLPKVTSLTTNTFRSCSLLKSFVCKNALSMRAAFYGCSSLELVDIKVTRNIESNTFYNCESLQTLILRNTTFWSLANTSAFTGTPIADGTGFIYVPAALVDTYKAATNWSTYAAQIRAIEDYPEITGG